MTVQVSRILHAGYLIENQGTKILFDPIFENPFSVNCYADYTISFDFEEIRSLSIDAVFISHTHDDHLSLESLNQLNREIPIYLYSHFEEFFEILQKLGFKKTYSIKLNEVIQIKNIKVLPLEALDQDVDCIFHIQTGGVNILNVVDSWITPQTLQKLKDTSPWHLILWPFQTMREIQAITPACEDPNLAQATQIPSEWAEQLQGLKPRALIPSSCQFRFEDWSWYNDIFFPISYRSFQKQLLELIPETQVCRMESGETLQLSPDSLKKGRSLSWVQRPIDVEFDYRFSPDSQPLAFPELAKHFALLNEKQQEQTLSFCHHTLPSILAKAIDEGEDIPTNFTWELRVFNTNHLPLRFLFRFSENQIVEVSPETKSDWQTEILETKLWHALFEGESLSSLYARIFPKPEHDPLQDPLLFALYHGKVASYQRAQLQRILKSAQS